MSELSAQVADLVRLLVSQPDAVVVNERAEDDGVVIELRVAPVDVGKIIGRRGATVRALRLLLELRGDVEDRDLDLDLIEDGNGGRGGADSGVDSGHAARS